MTLSAKQHKQFQRIAQQVKCPTCNAQSVYESDTQESLHIRQEILRAIHLGYDDQQILIDVDKDRHTHEVLDQDLAPVVNVLVVVVLITTSVMRYRTLRFRSCREN